MAWVAFLSEQSLRGSVPERRLGSEPGSQLLGSGLVRQLLASEQETEVEGATGELLH